MKKRMLSLVLCFCMAISLLPMSVLAADYNSWVEATADGVTLTADTDTVTIDGVAYTYKGDISSSGLQTTNSDYKTDNSKEIYKAGDGYVLLTWPNGIGTIALTLHNASITTAGISIFGSVNVTLEGNNSITTDGNGLESSNSQPNLTIGGSGYLTVNAKSYALKAVYQSYASDTLTIQDSAHLTLTGSMGIYSGTITIKGSGVVDITATDSAILSTDSAASCVVGDTAKVTAKGEKPFFKLFGTVNVGSGASLNGIRTDGTSYTVYGTVTVPENKTLDLSTATSLNFQEGSSIVNSGTIKLPSGYTLTEIQAMNLSGSGALQIDGQAVAVVDGVLYYDVSTSGLNISGSQQDGTADTTYNAPTEETRYKAGNGYISYTPAVTGDTPASAKLELHNATINTTSGRALFLPAAPVDITVTGDNALTANGSYNFAIDPNGQAVSITGAGSLSLTGSKGIASWFSSTPGVTVDIDGNLVISANQTYSISGSGNIDLSAAGITTGIITAGNGLLTATAKTGNLTIDNGTSNSTAVYAANITLNAPNGAISVAGKGNRLLDTSGMVTLNAKGNIAFTSSDTSSVPIGFGTGVSMTSDAGSIDVTTSGYSGIEKSSGGTGGGGVTLSAAKDITLNADNTAISTSTEAVNLTAVGKLTAKAQQGIVAGALTVKANEVDVTSSTMDGIQATSLSITNPTGGNCKRVSVTATSNSDSWAAIHALGSATTGNITVKADDLFLCGNGSAKAISAPGTVNIEGAGLIVGAIAAGTKSIAAGVTCANVSGGDKSGGLNLSTAPAESTVYTAGSGYVLFTPATTTPAAPAKLTLHNATIHNTASINDETGVGIALPDGAVTIAVEGTNTVGAQYTNAIGGSDTDVTGSGVLNVGYNGIALKSTAAHPHSFTKGTNVTLNGIVETYDNLSESGASDTNTVYGSVTFPSGSEYSLKGAVAVTGGAVLTIPQGATLDLTNTTSRTNNGTIVNNGAMLLPDGTDAVAIQALKLIGTGMVKVVAVYDEVAGKVTEWDYYTNAGVAVKAITGGLDLSSGDDSGTSLTGDGYTFSNNTLTLANNAYVMGNVTLPTHATISTPTASTINGSILPASSGACDLTFSGTGSLTVGGNIGNSQGGTMTVSSGTDVTVNGSVNIGTSGGANGTLNVTGAGTTLNVSSSSGYAVLFETVNVEGGAHLTAKANGTDTMGVEALSGGVHITGGSTLETGCDYGVYIIGGKLEVDSTSKLITNGAVAPFCIVGVVGSTVDQVLSLPSTPSGTTIQSATGTSGKYWSLVPTGGSLTVSNEGTTPVTLSGAKTGLLTFVTASSGGNSGGTSGGGSASGSTNYTLTFETNGGSAISSMSKASGIAVDLSSYKPTRDGYTFVGWYSDAALTTKVTSVTLSKSTTVYAKWREKTAQSANPFADVADSAYYHDAVLWALENSVTSGTSDTEFGPDKTCTRAQLAAFLWRAEGSPEPTATNCSFTDVAQGAYYYKAVLWAVEKGITAGSTETSFNPNGIVSRGQAVTFMWRAAGEPETTSATLFADVAKDAYYYNAVLWAVEKGVTAGTSAKAFGPAAPCTRAQIVTFLYRYMGNRE